MNYESKDGQHQTGSEQAGAVVPGRIDVAMCRDHAIVPVIFLAK
jgi:hypothetical protein